MLHGLTGSTADKYRAELAAKTLALYEELNCATWRDGFEAVTTEVTAETTDEGVQFRLEELAVFIEAWYQALTQRRTQTNEQGT